MKPSDSNSDLPKVQVKPRKVFAAKRISQDKPAESASTMPRVDDEDQAGLSKAATEKQSTASKKRKITSVDDAEDREPDSEPKAPIGKRNFSYLKKHTKRLPQETVKKRWKALQPDAQDQVRALFQTAKRSVMHGAKDERRAREIEAALGTVLRRLEKQLPRMPFPPKAKDWMFNLDQILERNRKLELDLTTTQKGCELLEEAIEEEELLIEEDRATLEDLKKDVKYEEGRRGKDSRAMHPLVKDMETQAPVGNACQGAMVHVSPESIRRWERIEDPDLKPLVRQFKSHLASMLSNKAQVDGLQEAIDKAEMALQNLKNGN